MLYPHPLWGWLPSSLCHHVSDPELVQSCSGLSHGSHPLLSVWQSSKSPVLLKDCRLPLLSVLRFSPLATPFKVYRMPDPDSGSVLGFSLPVGTLCGFKLPNPCMAKIRSPFQASGVRVGPRLAFESARSIFPVCGLAWLGFLGSVRLGFSWPFCSRSRRLGFGFAWLGLLCPDYHVFTCMYIVYVGVPI